jgi:6-phosphogluconolactonase/glucosamine-6-phosphate isomerase/deaminase
MAEKLTDLLAKQGVPFYTNSGVNILQVSEERAAELSLKILTETLDRNSVLFLSGGRNHVAILGVGIDAHTAGIPSDPSVWQEFDLSGRMKTEMVIDYDDHGPSAGSGFYGERISMSFLALSHMDLNLVLVFGHDKKRALEWMFADGSEEEVPSRFFKRPDIAPKTLLITDQEID